MMKAKEQDCKTVILVGLDQHDTAHICSHLINMDVFAAPIPSAQDFLVLITQTTIIPIAIILKLNSPDLETINHIIHRAKQQFIGTSVFIIVRDLTVSEAIMTGKIIHYLNKLAF